MKKKIITTLSLASLAVLGLTSCGSEIVNKENSVVNYNDLLINEREAKTVYVDVEGTFDGAGTKESPLDFFTAVSTAAPGDTILLKGGVYNKYTWRQELKYSGKAGKYITVKPASEEDRVVFDFSKMRFDGTNRGIQIYGDFWHFQDIEVCGAGDNGMYVAGSHNIIENCIFYNNRDTGLQIGRGYSEQTRIDLWPSYNLIKNCTSFANYDEETLGENADGFAAKLTVGYGNVFDGCMAYRNSDDGWDLFAKVDSGNIGTVVLYNCVSFENGYLPYQIKKENIDGSVENTYNTINGDGIGFKLGGSVMEGDVTLNNCIAFNNKLHGIGDNSNPGFIKITNSSAINNCIGLNLDGTVAEKRGIDGVANKSNNIDLARSMSSYNSYEGVLSYINNQANFPGDGDNSYNHDQFRGSVSNSIFQTSYDNGEVYTAYTDWIDGSSWTTDKDDVLYDAGQVYKGLSDASFGDLSPVNAVCNTTEILNQQELNARTNEVVAELIKYHTQFRNADGSINLGNKMATVDEKLLTYNNGKPIGAVLNKTSQAKYPDYGLELFQDEASASLSDDDVKVMTAATVAEPLTRLEATFQTFELPKLVGGCEVSWTSSNTDVIYIEKSETTSVSYTVFSNAVVVCPKEETKVTLTATIRYNNSEITKDYELTVIPRKQDVGAITTITNDTLRLELYSKFVLPHFYSVDASSTVPTYLPEDLYDMTYTYEYAKDGNSKFYPVDNVYTSVAGVYRITVTANSKKSDMTSSYVFNVYVVDPDCDIDFIGQKSDVQLTAEGFKVSGKLSNIEGAVYAVVSKTPLANITANDILSNPNVQSWPINSSSVAAEFKANNSELVAGTTQYYAYYIVSNKNQSKSSQVYSFSTDIVELSTKEEFYQLATTGKLSSTPDKPTIYSLTQDLDFTGFNWEIKKKDACSAFNHLFNGNNHTISNLTISGGLDTERTITVNVFYKVQNGTIMNLKFNEINLQNTDFDSDAGKQVGIIGDLQGGYVHNVHLTNVKAYGKESIGGLVGQVTGGYNVITNCSLVNPEWMPQEGVDPKLENYVISATNKYAAGLVGNSQMNSDQFSLSLIMRYCYVNATIGDGRDVAGNTGGILGRTKNDSVNYLTDIQQCVFRGTVIAKGQYNAGIVGDFDNGSGHVIIRGNLSDVVFIYDGQLLDVRDLYDDPSFTQQYAHKNSNPIVGRAVKNDLGIYDCGSNIGSWKEYYSTHVGSISLCYDLVDEETGELSLLTKGMIKVITDLDFEVFEFEEVKDANGAVVDYKVYLK